MPEDTTRVIPSSDAQVAGYVIEEELGRGGMGVVYRARQIGLDRTVALKLIAPQVAGDPAFVSRFRAESRTAAPVEHPNVVPIYEAGERDGVLFIAMRYVRGTDLKALLRTNGRVGPERAVPNPIQSRRAASVTSAFCG